MKERLLQQPMNGPREYYLYLSKSDRERQTWYDIMYAAAAQAHLTSFSLLPSLNYSGTLASGSPALSYCSTVLDSSCQSPFGAGVHPLNLFRAGSSSAQPGPIYSHTPACFISLRLLLHYRSNTTGYIHPLIPRGQGSVGEGTLAYRVRTFSHQTSWI